MPSPDLIAPERLEELMGGAVPEGEREALVQGIVRELRTGAPAAPARCARACSALEVEPVRRRRVLPRRRTALRLRSCVLLAVGRSGLGGRAAATGADERGRFCRCGCGPTRGGCCAAGHGPDAWTSRQDLREPRALSKTADRRRRRPRCRPSCARRGRATDVSLWMEVRLPDADELSAAAAEAMGITRELGGWVAASDIDTEGNEGRAELALRVPVGPVEDAVVRLGALGTVTGERVATVDLQTGIDRATSTRSSSSSGRSATWSSGSQAAP